MRVNPKGWILSVRSSFQGAWDGLRQALYNSPVSVTDGTKVYENPIRINL